MTEFPTVPRWATSKNYIWHSNPESRPLCRTYFDKCVTRPKLDLAWSILKGDKQGDRELAENQVKLYSNDAAKAAAGRIVQKLCDDYLITNNADTIEDAIAAGRELFSEYTPRDWDDDKDRSQLDLCIMSYSDVFKNAVKGITEAQNKLRLNKLTGEQDYMFQVPGLSLEYFGKPDFNGQIELKTTWSSVANTKSGKRTTSIPSQPKWSHLCQVAGYWAMKQQPQSIVYANENGYRVFDESNCEKLTADALKNIWNHIVTKCRIRENQLKTAETVHDLIHLVEPDFSHMWAWDVHPDVLAEAKQLWGFV
tara:strand:+ start:243 stop:1169 length:927 start_codon:yes stop_codon:yes gene_type:complete